jgi:mycothiol synthase
MQLHMVLSLEAFAAVRPPALPDGYLLRTFRDSDRDGWIRLMRLAGFDGWSQDSLKGSLSIALPEGVFFVEHGATRELVATAMAGHKSSELHPFGGELGWVAVSPPHRGRRLSSVVCVEVTRRLVSAGYREIYLSTDDWRLPAVKTYLNLGYVPLLCASDMEERWRLLAKNLGIGYEALGARRP